MYRYYQRPFSYLRNAVVGHIHYARKHRVIGQPVTENIECRTLLTVVLNFESQDLANVLDNDYPRLQQACYWHHFHQQPVLIL